VHSIQQQRFDRIIRMMTQGNFRGANVMRNAVQNPPP
jgi:hypothetical protein